MRKMTDGLAEILIYEEGIRAKHEEGSLVGDRYERALENARRMRSAEQKAYDMDVEEILDAYEAGKLDQLPLMEKQYLAAKVMGWTYSQYRMYAEDVFGTRDAVEFPEKEER